MQVELSKGRMYHPTTSAVTQLCWYELSRKKLLTVPNAERTCSTVQGRLTGSFWKLTSITIVFCSPIELFGGVLLAVVVAVVVLVLPVVPELIAVN